MFRVCLGSERGTYPCEFLFLLFGVLEEFGGFGEDAVDNVLWDAMVLDVAE